MTEIYTCSLLRQWGARTPAGAHALTVTARYIEAGMRPPAFPLIRARAMVRHWLDQTYFELSEQREHRAMLAGLDAISPSPREPYDGRSWSWRSEYCAFTGASCSWCGSDISRSWYWYSRATHELVCKTCHSRS